MAQVFISFRKVDDRAMRERIYHALVGKYGAEAVFKSGESIQPGTNYIEALLTQARGCTVMVVLIGADWLAAHDENGVRLLNRPDDWVRREIVTALQAGNRVLPVLVGDGTMLPRPDELPPDIAVMANLQALRIEHSAVETGLSRLLAVLDETLPGLAATQPVPLWTLPPEAAQQNVQVHDGGGLAIGGNVTGFASGRDLDARGATLVTGDQQIINKKGGQAAAVASVATSAGIMAALRRPLSALAGWSGAHKPIAVAVAATFTVAGVVTAVTVTSNSAPGDPGAVSTSTSSAPVPGALGIGASLPPTSSSPTPVPTASAGTTITAASDQGQVIDKWADGSILAVETQPTNAPTSNPAIVTAYSLSTGQQVGSYTPEVLTVQNSAYVGCVDGMIRNDTGADLLVTEKTVVTPAQGLTPGSSAVVMSGLDAVTGAVLWTANIPGGSGSQLDSDYCVRGGAEALENTANRKYLLVTETSTAYSVNLDTGAAVAVSGASGVLGNQVAAPTDWNADDGQYTTLDELDPGTGAITSKITDPTLIGMFRGNNLVQDYNGMVALMADPDNPNTIPAAAGYAMPSGSVEWSIPDGQPWGNSISLDPDTGAAINYETPEASQVSGFSPTTGAVLWTVPDVQYCGATHGHVYVSANNQLVMLDETTGKQLSYDASVGTCPDMLDGVLDETVQDSSGQNTDQFVIG